MELSAIRGGARECRDATYFSLGKAMQVFMKRSDDVVAYRCGVCGFYHIGRGSQINIAHLMAEGRFIAG